MTAKQMGLIILRERKKLPPESMARHKVAEKAGISESHLCLIEQGKRKPSLDIAMKIAESLGIDKCDFIRLLGFKN
ncbi:MAG: hypothetical protein DDT19_00551 [Syntrophomonadaceae bacterium]|nr:hypothetical protein [Bacillota bacterium]